MKHIITENQEETFKEGIRFANSLKGGEIVALYGDLGAGKTTFTSGVVNYFLKGKRVLSPTFVIVRHYYPLKNKIRQLIHADLYRLKNVNDIEELGLQEYMGKLENIVLIEWADKMEKMLPEKRVNIYFESQGSDQRKITYG